VLTLLTRVLAYLQADATLIALCPAANMTPSAVSELSADAPYPHISMETSYDAGGGPADYAASRKVHLAMWVESQVSLVEAKGIADRIVFLLHRQQDALNNSTVCVKMIKLSRSPISSSETPTKAKQVSLDFEVIAE
jgi:hypothetical protein